MTTRAATGDGDSLSVTQERDLVLQMCRALVLHCGGEVVLDLELCDRAIDAAGGELRWDKVNEYGKVRVYLHREEG